MGSKKLNSSIEQFLRAEGVVASRTVNTSIYRNDSATLLVKPKSTIQQRTKLYQKCIPLLISEAIDFKEKEI